MNNIFSKIINFFKGLGKFALVIAILAAIYYGIDFAFQNMLSFNARAVLANFIVFAMIIGFVLRQAVHPKAILEQAQTVVENEIKDSITAKEESDEKLATTQKEARGVKKEINAILKKSEENAQLVGAKIIEDAKKTALVIQDNTEKSIETNLALLKNDILKRASLASIEIAKNQILNELNNNSELHDKLIDESIEAIILEEKNEAVEEVEQ